ncbi:hypothetical protein [Ancylomarina sp. 16SWW S1-10-2]|uniref:hypothetical protein n=1 Tax=Ancylomarina sp. 16SWW S1-10-2 TaxID=2499681 RepID=UPI0012AE5EEC|nr:hypothetical protein [Ancylomarina sp. 16SWW S1-10-2]MRT94450.1 hypothetical protein [Ancylomarina sp. 16SWW S1-10-2]
MKYQNIKFKVLSFVFLFSICSTAFAQLDWVKTKSDKSKISFDLPEIPYVKNQELNGITSEVFSFRDAANIFGIVASDFSSLELDFSYADPTEYYNQLKEGSLLSSDTKLISEQSVSYKRMLGKEICYTMMLRNLEYTYFKRFFFKNHFIYQITIGGPTRMKRVLLDKKHIFFNSIEFE